MSTPIFDLIVILRPRTCYSHVQYSNTWYKLLVDRQVLTHDEILDENNKVFGHVWSSIMRARHCHVFNLCSVRDVLHPIVHINRLATSSLCIVLAEIIDSTTFFAFFILGRYHEIRLCLLIVSLLFLCQFGIRMHWYIARLHLYNINWLGAFIVRIHS